MVTHIYTHSNFVCRGIIIFLGISILLILILPLKMIFTMRTRRICETPFPWRVVPVHIARVTRRSTFGSPRSAWPTKMTMVLCIDQKLQAQFKYGDRQTGSQTDLKQCLLNDWSRAHKNIIFYYNSVQLSNWQTYISTY